MSYAFATESARAGAASQAQASRPAPRRQPDPAIGNRAALRIAMSAGIPLPSPFRARAEHLFGASLGDVRVHDDDAAAAAARRIGARAFTVGNNIYFGEGWYQPRTRQGDQLAGHELAHVLQQRNGVAASQSRAEEEADHAGKALREQRPFAVRGGAAAPLQMQPLATPDEKPKKEPLEIGFHFDEKKWEEWRAIAKVKKAIADKLAHEYVKAHAPAPLPRPRTPQPLAPVTTYLEANVAPPPTEERISLAIQNSLDKIKGGKGDKLSDWTWKPSPEGAEKTAEEKLADVGKWGAEEAATKFAEGWVEKKWPASPAVAKWGLGATNLMPRYLAKQELFKAGERQAAKLAISLIEVAIDPGIKEIIGTIAVASGAGEVVGFLLLAWSVFDLFRELGERKEPSAGQLEDERIVNDVLLWLQEKEADEAYEKAGRPLYGPIRNPVDVSAVSPFTFPH